jgi:hypothetical protein
MNALEEKVLELIGEDPEAPDVFLDTDEGMAQIRESIADAIAEIVMLTGSFKRQYFLPLRDDQAFYRIRLQHGDMGWITDAWAINTQRRLEQTDLIRLNAHDPRWMVTTGTVESYIPVGQDIIGFYPKPSGSSDVVEITVVEIPHTYESDRDRVKLREAFKYATVNYAVCEYWASRGDAAEAQKHFMLYLDALGLRQDYMQQTERPYGATTQKEPWPKVTG